MPRPPGRPRKSTHDVDLARDCWEFIFRRFLDSADPDVAVPSPPEQPMPNANRLVEVLGIGGFLDDDEDERFWRNRHQHEERVRFWHNRRQHRKTTAKRVDFVRTQARTLLALPSVSKTFKKVCDEGGLFAHMCDTLWTRAKRLDNSLENGDRLTPPTMTSAQKLRLFEGTGCQCCDRHPLISFKWVFWAFGARLCERCSRVRMVPERDLLRDPDTLPEHYRGLRFSADRWSTMLDGAVAPGSKLYWRADVDERKSVTRERQKREREAQENEKKSSEKRRRKQIREEKLSQRDDVREQRKKDIIQMMTTTFNVTEAQLETSETYRKHSAMARPLTARFHRTHMRQILDELPEECRRRRRKN